MAKSQQTFGKKEREKKRLKKRQDKLLKKEGRKATSMKGASFEDQLSYVDENGQLVDTPPDLTKKKKIDAKSIELGVPKREKEAFDPVRRGRVAFFNDQKGYGFITDLDTDEKHFVHVNGLIDEIKENNMVTFELEKGQRGMNAVRVRKA